MTAHRSWGPGWPNCQTDKLLTFSAGGRRWTTRREVAPIFKHFIDEIVANGYRISDGQLDDWSFNCRPIAGTNEPSNHSYGLAVDINSLTNPMTFNGRLVTNVPRWVVAAATAHGLVWGGNYSGRKKDPMHFEWTGSLAEATRWGISGAGAGIKHATEPKDNFMAGLTDKEQHELLANAKAAALLAASADQRCARLEATVHGTDDKNRNGSIFWRVHYLSGELLEGDNLPRLRHLLKRWGDPASS